MSNKHIFCYGFISLREKADAEIWKELSFILMQYKIKYAQSLKLSVVQGMHGMWS